MPAHTILSGLGSTLSNNCIPKPVSLLRAPATIKAAPESSTVSADSLVGTSSSPKSVSRLALLYRGNFDIKNSGDCSLSRCLLFDAEPITKLSLMKTAPLTYNIKSEHILKGVKT
uniref:Uncharacterized protein n=1 Tax=Glossina palpalis gambiensis TaxID=67801 RepID=A0A1B0AQ11_9MUSC